MAKKILFLCISIFAFTSCTPGSGYRGNDFGELKNHDYLIYMVTEKFWQGHLFYYDPIETTHIPLVPDRLVSSFSVSSQNRLAFSVSNKNGSDIYLLDFPFWKNEPINLTKGSGGENYVDSWSPDGKFLVSMSFQNNKKNTMIWDGVSVNPIHQFSQTVSEMTWSSDDRLAFTEFNRIGNNPGVDYGEVYLWEGGKTVSVSQNSEGDDRFPAWSKDGKLAFLSNKNNQHDILVWDGKTISNGLPDVRSYENIAPGLTFYESAPVWTNRNTIAFEATQPGTSFVQVYEWDGKTARNISQNPEAHNGGQRWSMNGQWSFITYFSSKQLIYIRDEKNQTKLVTKGQYSPAWSETGLLMFCRYDRPSWTLSIWNGKTVITVVSGQDVKAVWRNGENVFCTSG